MNFSDFFRSYGNIVVLLIIFLVTFVLMLTIRNAVALISALIGKLSKRAQNSPKIQEYKKRKLVTLIEQGADYYLMKDGVSVDKWYAYKFLLAAFFGAIGTLMTILFRGADAWTVLLFFGFLALGFFFPDLFLYSQNKAGNEAMLPDIMEASRSVLYRNRAGEYIGDSLASICQIVENERLKIALIQLRFNITSGVSINDSILEMESHFNNAEIESFCTVIRSLQDIGQANDALETMKANVAREQNAVNERYVKKLQSKVQVAGLVCFGVAVAGLIFILFQFIKAMVGNF